MAMGYALKRTLKWTGVDKVGEAIIKHLYRRRSDIARIILPPIVLKVLDPSSEIQRWVQRIVDGE